jgi:hypothetical protein
MKKEGYLKLRHILIVFIIIITAGCKMPFGSDVPSGPAANSISMEPVISNVSPEPDQEPVIHITPEIKEISVNDKILLEIKVDNVSNLSATSFYVMFDTALLKFEGAAEGTFLNRNNTDRTSFLFSSNPNKGRIIVGHSRIGQTSGASGSGLLMTVKFMAIAKGTADISFSNTCAKVSNGSKQETIPVSFAGAKVCVK